jgi:hypothetical protein
MQTADELATSTREMYSQESIATEAENKWQRDKNLA